MQFIEHSGKQVFPLRINGAALPFQRDRFIPILNARDNVTVSFAQGANEADAQAAVDSAAHAFQHWRSRAEEIAQAPALETSCTVAYARFMPKLAVAHIREIAGATTAAVTGSIPPMGGDGYGFVVRDPVGVILCIVPWNSPPALGMQGLASILAAGCTSTLKAWEVCPLALCLVNDSAYGLSAAIWTENMGKALEMTRRLDYDQVHVKSTTVNDPPALPVSGAEGNGWSSSGGRFGIEECLVYKTVTLHRSDEKPSFGS